MHPELKPGQIIIGHKVQNRRPLRWVAFFAAALTLGVTLRTGTTVTTFSNGPKPAVVCGGMTCGSHAGSGGTGHGGGGGTIKIGETY